MQPPWWHVRTVWNRLDERCTLTDINAIYRCVISSQKRFRGSCTRMSDIEIVRNHRSYSFGNIYFMSSTLHEVAHIKSQTFEQILRGGTREMSISRINTVITYNFNITLSEITRDHRFYVFFGEEIFWKEEGGRWCWCVGYILSFFCVCFSTEDAVRCSGALYRCIFFFFQIMNLCLVGALSQSSLLTPALQFDYAIGSQDIDGRVTTLQWGLPCFDVRSNRGYFLILK